ncbi:MAG: TonB family protein [Terracidiphilus sp.]|jgi:protein TonB
MVPPEELEKAQPATLPADFGEWDSGENHAAPPPPPSSFDGYSGGSSKPAAKPVAARVAVLPAVGRAQSAPSRTSASTFVDVEPVYQAPQSRGAKVSASRQKVEIEDDGGEKKKTGLFIGIGVAAVLLLGGGFGYMKMHSKPAAASSTAPTQTAISNLPQPTPSAMTMTANGSTPAPGGNATTATTTTDTAADRTQRASSENISAQLSAQSKISTDLRTLAGKEAPTADFGSVNADGLGSGSSPFSGQTGPKVKVEAAHKVSVSSGVAVGLLLQRTAPAYPPIAKSAHVSGTVVIQVTIAKNGSVGNLRAISGPAMLRQSALDAVKNWRFRPYMLDGQPVEVDTTVNVTYAAAQ